MREFRRMDVAKLLSGKWDRPGRPLVPDPFSPLRVRRPRAARAGPQSASPRPSVFLWIALLPGKWGRANGVGLVLTIIFQAPHAFRTVRTARSGQRGAALAAVHQRLTPQPVSRSGPQALAKGKTQPRSARSGAA